jgi:hypothetical protein
MEGKKLTNGSLLLLKQLGSSKDRKLTKTSQPFFPTVEPSHKKKKLTKGSLLLLYQLGQARSGNLPIAFYFFSNS